MATDIFDNIPHKVTPDGRSVPDFGVSNPFDSTKPGPSYKDLFDAATEDAAETAAEVSKIFAARDATISSLRVALERAAEALDVTLDYLGPSDEDWSDERYAVYRRARAVRDEIREAMR